MQKYQTLQGIGREKVIGIVRLRDDAAAEKCFAALCEGGIRCAELPFTVPYAHTVLESVSRSFGDSMLIGAGTILDAESARIAVLSGAKFVVTPNLNTEVLRMCNRYGIPVICGVATPSEAAVALEWGVDAVKLFPADQFSYGAVKAFKGPFPNLEVVPTGGIGAENVADWLRAGAFACGVGGRLLQGADEGDFGKVRAAAKALCGAVRGI